MDEIRLFAALPIPDEIADRVAPLQRGVPGARWRPEENFHITLAFFGDLDMETAEELDLALAKIRVPPFNLKLKGAGKFGSKQPYALWLGVEAPSHLDELHRKIKRLARSCQVDLEKRKFRPHLTLAYLRGPSDDGRIASFLSRLADYESQPFIADRFYLYSSQPDTKGGPNIYKIEAEYPLSPRRV